MGTFPCSLHWNECTNFHLLSHLIFPLMEEFNRRITLNSIGSRVEYEWVSIKLLAMGWVWVDMLKDEDLLYREMKLGGRKKFRWDFHEFLEPGHFNISHLSNKTSLGTWVLTFPVKLVIVVTIANFTKFFVCNLLENLPLTLLYLILRTNRALYFTFSSKQILKV